MLVNRHRVHAKHGNINKIKIVSWFLKEFLSFSLFWMHATVTCMLNITKFMSIISKMNKMLQQKHSSKRFKKIILSNKLVSISVNLKQHLNVSFLNSLYF